MEKRHYILKPRVCSRCGQGFLPTNSIQKYCSKRCKQLKAHTPKVNISSDTFLETLKSRGLEHLYKRKMYEGNTKKW